MYNIRYLQKSQDDLDEIFLYISQDSLKSADKMIGTLLNHIEQLEEFPYIGISVSNKIDIKGDYRMLIVEPYLVFYRVIGEEMYIYRILHQKRYYEVLIVSKE